MRNLFLLAGFFCAFYANAQTYLISFNGSGESTTVSTVKIENLTTGTTLIINGTDVLRLNSAVGISDFQKEKTAGLKIYPNPMADKSTLLISAPEAGDAVISVYDVTGRIMIQSNNFLDNYTQEYTLSGLKNGSYIIHIKGNTYQLSGKIISNGKSNGLVSMEKINNNFAENKKTSKFEINGDESIIDMEYTSGNLLKITGSFSNYTTVVMDVPTENKTITFDFISCTDGEGYNYPVVKIGPQIWMAENLKTSRYRNGESIGTTTPVTLNIQSEVSATYQWAYDGDESNVDIYGRLYTWFAVTDNRYICPTGWHAPNGNEWIELTDYLGEYGVAGTKLKETGSFHWTSPNTHATNESGFSARPGGTRLSDGYFWGIREFGYWWSSSFVADLGVLSRTMSSAASAPQANSYPPEYGFSVRCIKDY